MEYFLPYPNSTDRCAISDLPILPSADYVQTYDELGRTPWWHMTCRDRMIPYLLAEHDGVNGRGEDDDL
jgi:hypothetical protein